MRDDILEIQRLLNLDVDNIKEYFEDLVLLALDLEEKVDELNLEINELRKEISGYEDDIYRLENEVS